MFSQRQVTIPEALNRFTANIFSVEGRSSRREFWLAALTIGLAAVAQALPTALLSMLAYGVALVGIATRRLHDAGFSGWWQLIVLVPGIGWCALFVLLSMPGMASENKYGPVPESAVAGVRDVLTVDRIKAQTEVLGPGVRTVVWFHGCRRNCPGCIAAEMNASEDYETYAPHELADRIGAVKGVTISGGEPFDQNPAALHEFLRAIRSRDIGVMVYTGYLREELEADIGRRRILDNVDILVDGPYREHEDHGELWRGSSNQRIHFLTDRYQSLQGSLLSARGRPIEVDLDESGRFSFVGVPPRGFRQKLAEAMDRRGLEVRWKT